MENYILVIPWIALIVVIGSCCWWINDEEILAQRIVLIVKRHKTVCIVILIAAFQVFIGVKMFARKTPCALQDRVAKLEYYQEIIRTQLAGTKLDKK